MIVCGWIAVGLTASGCWKPRDHLPGQTRLEVREVFFEGASWDPGAVIRRKLGLRPNGLLFPGQPYNPYREAEDRRRLTAFWQTMGWMDVEVTGPEIKKVEGEDLVDVVWHIKEGPRYKVASVELPGAPPEHLDALMDIVPFRAGDDIDMEVYRLVRAQLSDYLRREGWAHAETYSRTFVDRDAKVVHWRYYVDTGPKTRVGKITVTGNVKIPAEDIIERSGLVPGEPFDLDDQDKAELDLHDTGTYAVAKVMTNADTEFLIGRLPPDTGGAFRVGQVDDDGELVPRELSPDIDVRIHVVEAPAAKGRFGAGGWVDTERLDASASGRVTLTNVFGPNHHILMEARFGYGWLFRGDSDEPLGLYGHGEVRYERPGLFARLLDFRLGVRVDERLFPGFHTRRITAGVGFRSTLAPGLFVDVAPRFRYEVPDSYGPFDTVTAAASNLTTDRYLGAELAAALVWDRRDNRLEAMQGHYLSLNADWSPGGPLGTHSYLHLGGEARVFVRFAESFAFAARAGGDWVLLGGPEGVPPGVRLFGGGAFGHRGFAYQHLTSYAPSCDASGKCDSTAIGALSLVEATAELRWLPFRKQWGAAVFVDVGGAGPGMDPFEHGVNVAVGIGGRIRLWYLPMSLDLAVRVTDQPHYGPLDRFVAFFRIGEAF